jgi:inosine-uridine nucleoside N-ribohydrolase
MTKLFQSLAFLLFCGCCFSCSSPAAKIPVVIDTDANNEVDDQHALAYLFLNGNTFDLKGVTINATFGGGDSNEQAQEADRIARLCNVPEIPIWKGANGNFETISPTVGQAVFDGSDAVDFIIEQAKAIESGKLVVIAVGKLTNVALAVEKEPSITDKIRLVWLGANYPAPGEYNLDNDIPSMNYLLDTNIEFEMVTVRGGEPSGTGAVVAAKEDILQKMPGKGPTAKEPVTGRHGKEFIHFGDYSVNLFEECECHGNPPGRSLFDMAAVAIVKNPAWAEVKTIPAPIMVEREWVERPDNARTIKVWENFDKEAILSDFYETMSNYTLIKTN